MSVIYSLIITCSSRHVDLEIFQTVFW